MHRNARISGSLWEPEQFLTSAAEHNKIQPSLSRGNVLNISAVTELGLCCSEPQVTARNTKEEMGIKIFFFSYQQEQTSLEVCREEEEGGRSWDSPR